MGLTACGLVNTNMIQTPDPPASLSMPYLSYLRALSNDKEPPAIDWAIANKNFYVADTRINRPDQVLAVRAALEAFARNPADAAASHLYEQLFEHRLLSGLYSEQRIPELGLSLDASTIGKLREFAETTTHRVVFINALIGLLASSRDLNTELLCAAAFESELTDAIWYVCRAQEAEPIQCDALTIALAKAGSYDARMWICSQLDSNPSDELRSLALRYAFSDATPESAELYGEPNPEFAPALVNFVKQSKLIEALEAEAIDDALCNAALRICSEGVCTSLVDGVELSYFRGTISIDVLLSMLIGHLQGRALTLDELFNLAWIYDCVFAEIDGWLSKDPEALFEESDLVIGRREHRDLAQKIRSVYDNPRNRGLLENYVEKGGVDGGVAKQTLSRVRSGESADEFLELLIEFQARLSCGANQRNVPITGFREMIEAAGSNASNATKVIEWCEDYFAILVADSSNLPTEAQYILRLALPLLRSRPGIGDGLIQAGLKSPAHNHVALQILHSWPVDRWPESVERLLRGALARRQRNVEALQKTIDMLVAHNTG